VGVRVVLEHFRHEHHHGTDSYYLSTDTGLHRQRTFHETHPLITARSGKDSLDPSSVTRGNHRFSHFENFTYADNGIYIGTVARSSTTSDVFNAIAEGHRREILDALITGEKAVGAIVTDLSMSQPQVSKHLRVLSEVGLVRCRAQGRRRLYRLEPEQLRPLHVWLSKYEQVWNDRLDRVDDYLKELQQQGEQR
jgi:DNA-binding transcriptional ArsR family regulator